MGFHTSPVFHMGAARVDPRAVLAAFHYRQRIGVRIKENNRLGLPPGKYGFSIFKMRNFVKDVVIAEPLKPLRTLTGEEAVAWGMAGEAVGDAEFAERLEAYCQELCAWSPITLRLLKRGMVRSTEAVEMEAQLRFEVSNIRRAFGSEDGQEARRAFLEKRKPVFQGR